MNVPYITGAAVGLNDRTLPGLMFNINAAYTGCLLCGAVYQSILDRRVATLQIEVSNPLNTFIDTYIAQATQLRKQWAAQHGLTHPVSAHIALQKSGLFCTPEAALKLTPLGIVGLNHTPNSDVAQAMFEAPRAPTDDVEGT